MRFIFSTRRSKGLRPFEKHAVPSDYIQLAWMTLGGRVREGKTFEIDRDNPGFWGHRLTFQNPGDATD
jgi:hypothetical protein